MMNTDLYTMIASGSITVRQIEKRLDWLDEDDYDDVEEFEDCKDAIATLEAYSDSDTVWQSDMTNEAREASGIEDFNAWPFNHIDWKDATESYIQEANIVELEIQGTPFFAAC